MSDRGEILELDEAGAEIPLTPPARSSVTTRSASGLGLVDIVPIAVTIGIVVLAVLAASRTAPSGSAAAQPSRSASPTPRSDPGVAVLASTRATSGPISPVATPILVSPAALPARTVLPVAPAPTPIRPGDPVAFAAVPSVGTLTFAYYGQRWRYRGVSGELLPIAPEALPAGTIARARRADGLEATLDTSGKLRLSDGRATPQGIATGRFKTVAWSPSGTRLALGFARAPLEVDAKSGAVWLWVWDLASNDARIVYRAPEASDPNWVPSFGIVSWSPDERYLAIREYPTNSASFYADGFPLRIVDVRGGSAVDLGWMLGSGSWLVWGPPHTAIYVAGRGRETWSGKQLRSWSPETGFRDLTPSSEVALAPALSPDARSVLFVAATVSVYLPNDFFAGKGSGARRLEVIDLASGARTTLARSEGYVQEGVRLSRDGSARLELRRPLGTMASPVPLEVHYVAANGKSYILLRLPQLVGFGYYGAFPSLVEFDWDESRQ